MIYFSNLHNHNSKYFQLHQLQNHPLDRKTFIVKQEGEYVVNRVITQGEDVQRSVQTFKAQNMQGFISEGIVHYHLQQLFLKKASSYADIKNC